MRIRVVLPQAMLLTPADHLVSYPQLIERCGRVCYNSGDRITDTSADHFVRSLIKRGHESVIEHCSATFKIICSRSCSHQIVRHRIAAFCLSGDTIIPRYNTNRKSFTIRELYKRQQNNQLRGRNKLMQLRSMSESGLLVPNRFVQVIYSGEKQVKEITTALGYKIKATDQHIFFNKGGEIKLQNLSVGDKLYVNGKLLYQDQDMNTRHVTEDTIISIENVGVEDTYDIEMCAPYHNFVANGFIVHNSQESQRYCDYGKLGLKVIMPPKIAADSVAKYHFMESVSTTYDRYLTLLDAGIPPEDARFILPNAAKTELAMTANLRVWRHVIRERYLNPHAQWEIKVVIGDVFRTLKTHLPAVFDDLDPKGEH